MKYILERPNNGYLAPASFPDKYISFSNHIVMPISSAGKYTISELLSIIDRHRKYHGNSRSSYIIRPSEL